MTVEVYREDSWILISDRKLDSLTETFRINIYVYTSDNLYISQTIFPSQSKNPFLFQDSLVSQFCSFQYVITDSSSKFPVDHSFCRWTDTPSTDLFEMRCFEGLMDLPTTWSSPRRSRYRSGNVDFCTDDAVSMSQSSPFSLGQCLLSVCIEGKHRRVHLLRVTSLLDLSFFSSQVIRLFQFELFNYICVLKILLRDLSPPRCRVSSLLVLS